MGVRGGLSHPQPQREVEARHDRNRAGGPALTPSPKRGEAAGQPRGSQPVARTERHDGPPWQRRDDADSLSGAIGAAVLIVLAAFLGPYIYIHFIEGPAPAKLELPKSSTATTSSTSKGSALDVVVARRELERRHGLHGGLPGARGPRRPERDGGGSDEQDLGLPDDRRFDGDKGDVHRRHGERRQRPEPAERSLRRIDHGREPVPDGVTHPHRADRSGDDPGGGRSRALQRRGQSRHAWSDEVGELSRHRRARRIWRSMCWPISRSPSRSGTSPTRASVVSSPRRTRAPSRSCSISRKDRATRSRHRPDRRARSAAVDRSRCPAPRFHHCSVPSG